MGNRVPTCQNCEFYSKKAINRWMLPRNWCNHSEWMKCRYSGRKKILSKEMGKTSPSWCPNRKREKEDE